MEVFTLAYIGFDDNGYEYFDEGNYVLFSSDYTHNDLFNYVTKDISCLSKLFEQYISTKIDTTTFELKKCQDNNDTITKIQELLESIHPYYKYEYKKVIIKAIGNYFNELLCYSVFHNKNFLPKHSMQKDWYFKRLNALIPSSIADCSTCTDDFYYEYKSWIGESENIIDETEESFIFNAPTQIPKGFSNEIQTQKIIYDMLYVILDIKATDIEKLTTSQRIWLYEHIYGNTLSKLQMKKQLLCTPPTLYRKDNDYSNETTFNRKIEDIFEPLHSLNNVSIGHNGFPEDMQEYLAQAIESAKTFKASKFYEMYEVNSLREILFIEILSMIESHVMIRKCKNCGKYFLITDRKVAYCNRKNESGKCCSEVGSSQSFQKKLNAEPPLKIYNRAYKTHFARRQKGTMTQDEFVIWSDQARKKLDEVRDGKLDISTFQNWLKE